MKRAQDMMHRDWYQELLVSQAPVSQVKSCQEGKMASLKALDDHLSQVPPRKIKRMKGSK